MSQSAEAKVREKLPDIGLYEVDDAVYMLWNYRPKIVVVGRDIDELWSQVASRISDQRDGDK